MASVSALLETFWRTSRLGNIFLKLRKYQNFLSIRIQIKDYTVC